MQFSEIKVKLDQLAGDVHGMGSRLKDLGTVASAVGEELDALPVAYGELITAIDTLADGSQDPAILGAKAELDLLVAEYLAAKETTQDVIVALA